MFQCPNNNLFVGLEPVIAEVFHYDSEESSLFHCLKESCVIGNAASLLTYRLCSMDTIIHLQITVTAINIA